MLSQPNAKFCMSHKVVKRRAQSGIYDHSCLEKESAHRQSPAVVGDQRDNPLKNIFHM